MPAAAACCAVAAGNCAVVKPSEAARHTSRLVAALLHNPRCGTEARASASLRLLDLGEWWEGEAGHPIPLGGIVARRSLGRETVAAIDRSLRESVAYAFAHPGSANAYIRTHSQEMSDEVCAAHIGLYVNEFSLDLGNEGTAAVAELLTRAEALGIIPGSTRDLFVP